MTYLVTHRKNRKQVGRGRAVGQQTSICDFQQERALAVAVIWQAVEDASLAESCKQKSTAAGWLLSPSEGPLTFRWWCDVAEMDPDNIVSRVRTFHAEYAQLARTGEFWSVLDERRTDET